ncbi:MAG: hypothetical protein LQ338_002646 [Usnochroma carphineum]|nr:MAG: hypothetical protein LQ338_002646 [Usnochroma carphineum]
MADLDDDDDPPIPPPSHHGSHSPMLSAHNSDSDSDNDTTLSFHHLIHPTTTSSALPRRGTKDFESHGTDFQASVLESSRQAMHDALSVGRVHSSRGSLVGFFDVRAEGNSEDKGLKGNRERRLVVIEKPSGQHIRTMGKADHRGKLWLLPEEVVYLVERGSLEVRYRGPATTTTIKGSAGGGGAGGEQEMGEREGEGNEEKRAEEVNGWDDVSMSLQACYAWFMGRDGLSLERYAVFAGLRRSGYIVLRAPGWYEDDDHDDGQLVSAMALPQDRGQRGTEQETWNIWQWLYKRLLERKPQDPPPSGPLVGPGLYRSYSIFTPLYCPRIRAYERVGDIYRLLHLIPSHDPTRPYHSTTTPASSHPSISSPFPLRPHFHIYKPTPQFRKSAPGPPDFHICVLNAREDSFPTLSELDELLQSVPYAPPPDTEHRSYQRLKHGYRNVVLAVVDQGVVSYMRVADAGFGRERMYEKVGRPGGQGKRGGGGFGAARGKRGGRRGKGR